MGRRPLFPVNFNTVCPQATALEAYLPRRTQRCKEAAIDITFVPFHHSIKTRSHYFQRSQRAQKVQLRDAMEQALFTINVALVGVAGVGKVSYFEPLCTCPTRCTKTTQHI